ncbi:MAG: hypothetical protein H6765_07485 [Candidatus Peribacteria bacterium]|nr:MAG: hypothetical protein H6765_07485 [Candidatus Peribacteria bacterium]
MVDGISASASEILAAALKQRDNGVLLGEQSFGKGTIQTLHDFNDGTMLKFTV